MKINVKQEIRSVELGSLSDATFFIFDHVTFIQFKICCCVHNFIEIGWFFAEIWLYNNFQNGGRPPYWILEIFIFDHVTYILFNICCCVRHFMKIRWFCTDIMAIYRFLKWRTSAIVEVFCHVFFWKSIYRHISVKRFTIRDNPRCLCCQPQLPIKFRVNLIHRPEDIAISR